MNNQKIIEKIERIFVEEEYLDEKFPKGDKRRGEVLALIGILNAKIQKVIKEKDVEIKKTIDEIKIPKVVPLEVRAYAMALKEELKQKLGVGK